MNTLLKKLWWDPAWDLLFALHTERRKTLTPKVAIAGRILTLGEVFINTHKNHSHSYYCERSSTYFLYWFGLESLLEVHDYELYVHHQLTWCYSLMIFQTQTARNGESNENALPKRHKTHKIEKSHPFSSHFLSVMSQYLANQHKLFLLRFGSAPCAASLWIRTWVHMPRRNVLIQVQSENQWVKPLRRSRGLWCQKSRHIFSKGVGFSDKHFITKIHFKVDDHSKLLGANHPLSSSFSRKTWEPSMVILCKNHEALPRKTIVHPTLFGHFQTPTFSKHAKNWGTKTWEANNLLMNKIPTFRPYKPTIIQALRGSCSPLKRHAEGDKKRIRSDTRVRWSQGHGAQDHLFSIGVGKSSGESPCFSREPTKKTTTTKKHQNPPSFFVWKNINLRKLGTKKIVRLFTSTNIIFPILTHQNAPNRLALKRLFFWGPRSNSVGPIINSVGLPILVSGRHLT